MIILSELYSVYKHTSPNGKVYIGITKMNPELRWQNGAGYKENNKFWKDILFYGWSNIKHEILYVDLTEEEAKNKEVELISRYKSNDEAFGYNKIVSNYVPKKDKRNVGTDINLLKSKMVANGDIDCVNALSKLLNISRTTASGKLNGYIQFKQCEITILTVKYDLSDKEIRQIFVGAEEIESS